MSAEDARYERAAVRGNTDAPVLTYPVIRGTVRRSDPDGSHAQPFFPSLSGTTIDIRVGGFGGVNVDTLVTFTSNNYTTAVADLNAAAPTHFKFVESEGFFAIQSLHGGEQSFLEIIGGDAPAILGIPVSPAPGSYSRAGDYAAAPTSKGFVNPQTAGLLGHDENLTSSGINRAILSSVLGLDRKLWDLDREVVVYKIYDAEQYNPLGVAASSRLVITDSGADGERINVDALVASIAATGDVSQAVAILTDAASPKAYYKPDGTLVKASNMAYGAAAGAIVGGTIPWGAPTGTNYSLSTTAAFISPKGGATPTAIDSIEGGVVYCPGATFETWQVQENDQVLIENAANTAPFSHDGVFVVTQVIDEERLALRPLGENEYTDPSLDKPPALNPATTGSFGDLTPLTGRSPILVGPSGGADDRLFIHTNTSLDPGTVVKVLIPVSTTIRQALLGGPFLRNVSFDGDDQIAYKNQANTFTKLNTFSAGLVASTPTAAQNAIVATGGAGAAGVRATGGAGWFGVYGIGGSNSIGVYGEGTGAGYGGFFAGGFSIDAMGAWSIGQSGSTNEGTSLLGGGAGLYAEGSFGDGATMLPAHGVVGKGGDSVGGRPQDFPGVGVFGRGGSPGGTGVVGINDGDTPTGTAITLWENSAGVYGQGSRGVYGKGASLANDGTGVYGEGDSVSGHGVHGVGGAGVENGSFGVLGEGGEDNYGVKGIGGSLSGSPLSAVYPAAGVYGKGGPDNTVGGLFHGGGTNGGGLVAQGLGTGVGIRAIGGTSGATGLIATGGSSNGTGIEAIGGTSNGLGLKATGQGTGAAVWIDGFALLTEFANASQPATPAASRAVVYLTENGLGAGSGKRQQLKIKFQDGSTVTLGESNPL